MRTIAVLLLVLGPRLVAQQPAAPFLYIYRDSLKAGVDSAYRLIENDGAQICADLQCPNPYLALESLSGPHEAWWVNAFASEADTARVARIYRTNQALAHALGVIATRKKDLIGRSIEGFAVYRRDFSRGPVWPVAHARFMIVSVTRVHRSSWGSVFEMADSTLYVFRPARTREQAEALAAAKEDARVFAIRPNWSMPTPEWVASDPQFWRLAPVARR